MQTRLAGAGIKGFKAADLPQPLVIPRPGDPVPEKPKVVTDSHVLAAWFAQNA